MFCLKEYQNKHILDLFLLENRFHQEDILSNKSP